MNISELSSRLDERSKRVSEITGKIKAVEEQIAQIEEQKQKSVKNGSSEQAIELLRMKRDKEDELQILSQVRGNIEAAPIISQEDIGEAWEAISAGIKEEFDEIALPELQEAFQRYNRAVDAVTALRQRAYEAASSLERIAKKEKADTWLNNPFTGAEITKYWPNKICLLKLNSVTGDITRPVSFDTHFL